MKNNFLIEYTCKGKQGEILSYGIIMVKNKENRLWALYSLESYLEKKHLQDFNELVLHSCTNINEVEEIS